MLGQADIDALWITLRLASFGLLVLVYALNRRLAVMRP